MTRQETFSIRNESVATLRASQVIFPQWMQDAVAGLDDDDLVTVTRQHAGICGTFVLDIEAL